MTKQEARRYAMRIIGDNELIIQNEYDSLNYVDGSQMSEKDEEKVRKAIELICNELINKSKIRKLYPESAVEYWKNRAEKFEAENALNEKLLDKEHNKLLDAQDYIKKLKEELRRCRAANADYLTAKQKAENEVKILKQEVADLKVPESRQRSCT